ncbi:hypothetical protein L8R85_24945 [Vibrio splendidus]|uniref:Uncharacterized protein n=1 Tax=Vibrio splendidus TaxID=29497 RepID=A0AA43G4K4_VIBSP|nr:MULTISPECIES: hypothetical protein [Vibrio]MDH5924253.1 hypothetical protein [Vibrio splendidus]MDH5935224.1 hypothetical protein [Vibrio splendidus]TCT94368.1 hypothetical protein EDB47_1525 [Vibrio crassostreae]CAK1942531.1 conserved hypothetical protein [Vibrio crassostreae]CAK2749926.1 conserved hypothetical protein [Vibrio crassostreae]
MFSFFKKKKTGLDLVLHNLTVMGYDILPYGLTVAKAELASGYRPAEIASHLAFTTMARDIHEVRDDFLKISAIYPHGMALLDVLKDCKDNHLINPAQWENDSTAVCRIITLDEQQLEWIGKILNDPVAGKSRLATSRIEYQV